jgi:hypothetical protein
MYGMVGCSSEGECHDRTYYTDSTLQTYVNQDHRTISVVLYIYKYEAVLEV